MAKMYGDRGREQWDSPDNKTKNYFKAREERQWQKDVEAERLYEQDCPHGLSVVDIIAGRKACYECYVLHFGGDPDGGYLEGNTN